MTVTFWECGGRSHPRLRDLPLRGQHPVRGVGLHGCGRTLIIDAGSGIRRLGDDLLSRSAKSDGLSLDLLLSHTHLDHILGLPFFGPLYRRDTPADTLRSGQFPGEPLEQVIGGQLSYRYFPVRQVELAAHVAYVDLREGVYDLGDGICLSATYLNHPLPVHGLPHRLARAGRYARPSTRNLSATCSSRDPENPDYDEVMALEGKRPRRRPTGGCAHFSVKRTS